MQTSGSEPGPAHRKHPRLAAPVATALALLVAAAAVAEPLHGQYFGRNKVQYDDFSFRVLETEHFRIHYNDATSEQAIEDAGRMAERWYDRFSRTFQHAFRDRKPVIFYADQADFQQTNAVPGFISQATGGVTEGMKNRVIMPFAETYDDTDHVLGHEIVHAFQYDLAQARSGGGATGFQQLPLWAVEGLAEYMSVGRRSSHTAMWMRDAVLRDDLPTIAQLGGGAEYFPYRFGHALWSYIGGRWGDDVVVSFYRTAAAAGLEQASRGVLETPLDTLSEAWRRDTRERYAPTMEDRSDPQEVGSRIVPGEPTDAGELNIAPSVSPDGERVVFLSQRDVFSVDLYVADARTGEVLGRLADATSDFHFDQLAFMRTSGTWSPDGSRFAFATYAEGDNQIAVADVDRRSVERRYRVPGVGGVYSMDWTPDGSRIVFSGTSGGVTDLFVLEVEDGSVERLTDDRWAQLHPSVAPDGSTVAFATDQAPGASLETLDFEEPVLGLMDLESGEVRTLQPFPGAKHVDPRWSPDGSSLYFISDRDGFSDVYRLVLDDGTVRRVTRVATGVSGLTELSPALTVARQGGDVLFTVFRDGGYSIRRLAAQETGGNLVASAAMEVGADVLPPTEAASPARVASYLDDPVTGLPAASAFEDRDYDGGLALDYVAQPTAGIAVDRFGSALGGSVAAFFSDMLGNRQLGVAVQANGQVQDIGGQVAYADLGSRLNWTLQAGRIPYRTAFAQRGTETRNGTELPTVDILLQRTILNRAAAGVRYPLSTTRRVEADVGASYIGFDVERFRTVFTPGGQPVERRRDDLDAPSGIGLFNGAVALVEDRSFQAFTSPVRGSRGRLEVEGNFGDLTFANVLADYRRYFFWNPLTLAVRGYHFGRYGADSESERLTPLFVGFERFVRGYDPNSFQGTECTATADGGGCPEFDRLVGSRIGVASAELRIPVNGTEQFGLLDWGVVPFELSFFADAGVAWSGEETPELRFEEASTDRIPVFSAGVSGRFNVLGVVVLEAYYARPFQRPERGWLWGFQVAPGW